MTNNSLYRKEALAAQSEKNLGAVILRLPGFYVFFSYAIVLLLLLIIVFIGWGAYSRHQTTKGIVVPNLGMLKVYPSRPGIVKSVFVKEEQMVEKGQIIMSIDTTLGLDGGVRKEREQISQLKRVISILEEEKKEQESADNSKYKYLNDRIARSRALLNYMLRELKIERERHALLLRQVNSVQELLKTNAISRQEFETRKLAELEARLQVGRLQRIIQNQENKIEELEAEKKQFPVNRNIRAGEYSRQLYELKRRLLDLEGRQGYSIIAPAFGRVVMLQVKVGEKVEPRQPVAIVVPKDTKYEVELLVPSRSIGLIKKGQMVRLRYQAFPFQRYGLQVGWIKDISDAGLASIELKAQLALPSEPHYRVRVELEKQQIHAYGKYFPLRPGMVVDADVILDQVPIWYWFFEPVLTLKGRL